MKVALNGTQYEHTGDGTLVSLLREIEADQAQVAVMINDEVVRASQFAATKLHDGDSLEVLTLMSGG